MEDRSSINAAEFEVRYRTVVEQHLNRLELFGLPRLDAVSRLQDLSLAYVMLHAEHAVRGASSHDEATFLMQVLAPAGTVQAARPAGLRVDELLGRVRRVVITGEPGSGKTTLAQWLAVRSAKRDFGPTLTAWNHTVPFFIRLRQRVDKGFPKPEEFPEMVARR